MLAVCAGTEQQWVNRTYLVLDARLIAGVIVHGLLHRIAFLSLALALHIGSGVLDTLHLLVVWLSGHIEGFVNPCSSLKIRKE
jgi:hypothetical protein